jgi:hypothetical protein
VGRRIERIHFFEAGCAGIAAIVPQLLTGGAAAYAPQNETNAMVLVITEALPRFAHSSWPVKRAFSKDSNVTSLIRRTGPF